MIEAIAQSMVSNSAKRKLKRINKERGTITIETIIQKNELQETFEIEVPVTLEALQEQMKEKEIIKAAANELFESERDRLYKTALVTEEEKQEQKEKAKDQIKKLREKADALGIDLNELL